LDEVLLIPAGVAPHKEIVPEPGMEVRLAMTKLAAEGNERFSVSDFEVRSDGPSYTFRTLEALTDQRPGDEFCFLMGADAAMGLESWREPKRVLELARLGIAGRPGIVLEEAEGALERLGRSDKYELIRMPELGVSSTRIRRRVAEGRPIRYLVPNAVGELIEERGLYREAAL
jgi:nicotinate-nucleotide adenylyltransferase